MTAPEIAVRVIAGVGDGPRLLVLAGVHGDEYEPMEAVRRLARRLESLPFRGSVTLVPVANPTAFAAATRTGSDGLDMARSFPGDPHGSPTLQAAHAVTTMLRRADCLIDLHTGGRAMRVLPMTGYTLHPDPRILDMQRRLARSFGLPVIWGTTPTLERRSLSAARDLGVRVYPISPLYHPHPTGPGQQRPAGLIMGYALLGEAAIVEGVQRLGAALQQVQAGTRPSQGSQPSQPTAG